jgi:hypothetical protein
MEPREAHRRGTVCARANGCRTGSRNSWRVPRHCHVSSGHSSRRKCRLYYRLVSVHVPLLVFDFLLRITDGGTSGADGMQQRR